MLLAYRASTHLIQRNDDPVSWEDLKHAAWVDMLDPDDDERAKVEAALQISLPHHKELRITNASNQIYRSGKALIMNARIVSSHEGKGWRLILITFILVNKTLITFRYGDSRVFRYFATHTEQEPGILLSGQTVMMGLVETIVGRAAELLQIVDERLETLSSRIFETEETTSDVLVRKQLQPVIRDVGRSSDIARRVRASLHTVVRILPHLSNSLTPPAHGKASPNLPADLNEKITARVKTVEADIASLLDHDTYLTSNANFLLDTMRSLINSQQNSIVKILSVVAVIFSPPTLIASIYGMNFAHMPELQWPLGYPAALVLMALSATVPYAVFKYKRWL